MLIYQRVMPLQPRNLCSSQLWAGGSARPEGIHPSWSPSTWEAGHWCRLFLGKWWWTPLGFGVRTLPPGKHHHNYGKSPFLMGKLTISMAMFNSYMLVYQRVSWVFPLERWLHCRHGAPRSDHRAPWGHSLWGHSWWGNRWLAETQGRTAKEVLPRLL